MTSGSAKYTFLNKLRVREDLSKALGGFDGSSGAGEELLQQVIGLDFRQQRFLFHWLHVIRQLNRDLAVQFVVHALRGLHLMDTDGVEAWTLRVMDEFDKRGLGAALDALEGIIDFAGRYQDSRRSVELHSVDGTLHSFLIGLGGRELKIEIAEQLYTDTESIFLPALVSRFPTRRQNRILYKAMAAWHWAQNYYGTWRYRVVEHLRRRRDIDRMLPVFACLESLRLHACLRRALPGLAREMAMLVREEGGSAEVPRVWRGAAAALAESGADAMLSCSLLARCRELPRPRPKPYEGVMVPAAVRARMFARVEKERMQLQSALKRLPQESGNAQRPGGAEVGPKKGIQFAWTGSSSVDDSADFQPSLRGDNSIVEIGDDIKSLLASIVQDFGEVPAAHLLSSAEAFYNPEQDAGAGDQSAATDTGYDIVDGHSYPEWDYLRQRFRDGFCRLQEQDVVEVEDDFVTDTLSRYHGNLKSIRRTFEAIADSYRMHRRQSFGNEIDLDALVAARSDMLNGEEMDDRLYTDYQKASRNIAVMFMIDMSGSTRGWVNRAEKESLVLLCEALETLGDRYAIYGFSGRTHKRCEIYRIKRFDDAYDSRVRARISGITPKTYTRMGVAIRHLGALLNRVDAQTRVLITLSDGKPEDYGSYRGQYGVEDTRHALLELSRAGVYPFCITIDKEAGDYLPHMYGVANYTFVDDVRKLPLKVSEIYRRLTT